MRKMDPKMMPPKKGSLGRVLKLLFQYYPVLIPVAIVCILFSAVVSSIPALFVQNVVAVI